MWPFNKEKSPSLMEERVVDMGMALGAPPVEPSAYTCDKCYGLFQKKGIRIIPTVTVLTSDVPNLPVLVGNEHFCISCAPSVGFILQLADKDGDLETRGFNVSDGWLQDRDLSTHEDMYVVDSDTYSRVHCDFCGEPVEVTGDYCKDCTKRQKKGK